MENFNWMCTSGAAFSSYFDEPIKKFIREGKNITPMWEGKKGLCCVTNGEKISRREFYQQAFSSYHHSDNWSMVGYHQKENTLTMKVIDKVDGEFTIRFIAS